MSKLFEYYKIYGKNEIKQGSLEWHKIRNLKFTASNAAIIAANGEGLETLVNEMLAKYYSSQKFEEYTNSYKSADMQRGNDNENKARLVYEVETGYKVDEVGFVERSKYIGCSPDGMITVFKPTIKTIDTKGLIEIKNHNDKIFLELWLNDKIDEKYIKQIQYQLWVTEADWCDYFGYNPNFNPDYYKERLYPDEKLFKKFEDGVITGIELIEKGLSKLDKKLKKED